MPKEWNRAKFEKGYTPWNKNMEGYTNNGSFKKQDSVGYSGVHFRIRDLLGEPKKCELCKTTTAKKYEWASLGHIYSEDIKKWMRVCTSCHRFIDKAYKPINLFKPKWNTV